MSNCPRHDARNVIVEDDRRGDDVAVNAGWERGRAGLRCDMVDVEEGRGGIESRAVD